MSKRTRATTRSRRPTKRAVEPGTRASPAVSLLRKQGWVRVWQGALSGASPPLKASLTPEHPEWAETGPPVTSRHPGPGSALSWSAQRRPAERPCSAEGPMGSGRAPPGVLQLSHQPMAYPWSASAPNLGAFKDSHGKSLQASWGCCALHNSRARHPVPDTHTQASSRGHPEVRFLPGKSRVRLPQTPSHRYQLCCPRRLLSLCLACWQTLK